tara:strand:+ start:521 stop:1357 length:837 start_codon:yes stop_codon:yes gene_type:complete
MTWHLELNDPIEAAVAEAMAPDVVITPDGNAFRQGDRDAGPNGTIRSAQTNMIRLGLDGIGEVDGVYGRNTMNAVQDAQGMFGLPRTGVLDQATQDAFSNLTDDQIAFFTSETEAVAATPVAAVEEEEDTFLVDLTEFLKEEESFRAEPYRATQGEEHLTIGYGHYGSDVKQGQSLTQKEAEALLVKDINQRLPAVRNNISVFDNLSSNLKVQIAQSWFRGGIAGSPSTIRLINQGKFSEAADEFLDNDEYRNAAQRGRRGVIARMDGLANALRAEAN